MTTKMTQYEYKLTRLSTDDNLWDAPKITDRKGISKVAIDRHGLTRFIGTQAQCDCLFDPSRGDVLRVVELSGEQLDAEDAERRELKRLGVISWDQ